MIIDKEMIIKYDVKGPRYTSYPTALQFHSLFTEDKYRWFVNDSNQHFIPKPLSLYLHIPFCKSLCYYCGCHKFITSNHDKVEKYLNSIKREIELQAKLFDKDRDLKQIHFGGGTPTYLTIGQLQELLQTIKENFTPSKHDLEIAIEVDPRTTDINDIHLMAELGINRMSFGVQDFDKEVQVAINRIQGRQQTLELLQAARQAGVKSISTDIIYGLPKQTTQSFKKTLNTIIDARPDRVALYNYAHIPDKIKSQTLIATNAIPSSNEKLELMCMSIQSLTDAGYQHIGMDHFALPEDALSISLEKGTLHRNFQGYSTHGDCDIIGIGVSAISRVNETYSQNDKELNSYHAKVKKDKLPIIKGYALSEEDQICSDVIQEIMCRKYVNFVEFSYKHQINFSYYFHQELAQLKPMINDGLITVTEEEFTVTSKGRLFLRNIAMAFDTYLMNQGTILENTTYSQVL